MKTPKVPEGHWLREFGLNRHKVRSPSPESLERGDIRRRVEQAMDEKREREMAKEVWE